jgi:hypothetical protein
MADAFVQHHYNDSDWEQLGHRRNVLSNQSWKSVTARMPRDRLDGPAWPRPSFWLGKN